MTTTRAMLAAAGLIAVVVAVIVILNLTADGEDDTVVTDEIGDCRAPGRDWGDLCDPGADVESIRLARDGETVLIDIELDSAPPIGPDVVWGVEFNAASTEGRVCGLANSVDGGEPGESLTAYGFDPAFGLSELTRKALPEGVCRASLDGSVIRFVVDMANQDPSEPFRVVGLVRLLSSDDSRVGSEDDFGFDVLLADL
jgi:hypothetical protein